jgi:hypothetical protein
MNARIIDMYAAMYAAHSIYGLLTLRISHKSSETFESKNGTRQRLRSLYNCAAAWVVLYKQRMFLVRFSPTLK